MHRRRLGFRLDHVAMLRQMRRTMYPEPVMAATVAQAAGAAQLNVHLREDRRHVQERDVRLLRQVAQTPLHVEMTASQDSIKIAYDIKPDSVTLLPETKDERTTERGLDAAHHHDALQKYVTSLRDGDLLVAVLIDPDLDQVRAAHRLGVSGVELHASKYADARGELEQKAELERIADTSRAAAKLGLSVSVGHGLNYQNIRALVPVDEIDTFIVGHAIVAQALWVGLDRAVRDMNALLAST